MSLPAKSTAASIYMRKKNKTELLVISSLDGARPPLSHIHVCDERALAQRAKKVLSDSPGLVDFAIGLVNSVFNLPDRQVMFCEEFE